MLSPDATYDGKTSDWVVMWATSLNNTMHTIANLDFHPTETSHVYKLVVTGQEESVDEVRYQTVRDICLLRLRQLTMFWKLKT